MSGTVAFVGAGTGDPRLLTLRGAEVLARADVVVHDRDVHPDILARIPEGATQIVVAPGMTAERIAQLLAYEARAGRSAVRLTWGDPLFFGHADVESVAVARHGIAIEIVPGIGPLLAIGAYAGCPLTRSTDATPSVAAVGVTSDHHGLHDWDKLATATDTLAVVCDADSLAETSRSLVFYGRAPGERVTLVENVSLPTQLVTETTLAEVPLLARAKAARIVLVVGAHAARVGALAWPERLPLFGKRVLVTRAREQSLSTAALLRERGADPVVVPSIEIGPPSDAAPLERAAGALGSYAWIVLTSANGVDRLLAEVRRQGRDARAFGGARIAAIGPGTAAALERHGLLADLVPKVHVGEGLAEELIAALGGAPLRVLVARAEIARDVVPDALRAAGCEVDVVASYATRSAPTPLLEALAELLEAGEIDAITFTSSSTVEHLATALGERAAELLSHTCVASIGPVTTETAAKRGIRVDATADVHTLPGLIDALERQFDLSSTGMRRAVRLP